MFCRGTIPCIVEQKTCKLAMSDDENDYAYNDTYEEEEEDGQAPIEDVPTSSVGDDAAEKEDSTKKKNKKENKKEKEKNVVEKKKVVEKKVIEKKVVAKKKRGKSCDADADGDGRDVVYKGDPRVVEARLLHEQRLDAGLVGCERSTGKGDVCERAPFCAGCKAWINFQPPRK